MSTFKEQLAVDITNTFLNGDEFAEEHELNGVTCTCVVQSPTAQEQFTSGTDYKHYEGIGGRTVIVHVAASDLPEIPIEGETYTLDGAIMEVNSCVEDLGMLSITLHENVR